MMTIRIPFQGFYDSIHSYAFDSHLEMEIESGHCSESVYDEIDWRKTFVEYSKEYVNRLSDELGIEMTFKDLHSPRFYNYETDTINAEISHDELEKLVKTTDKQTFFELVKRELEPASGFIPNYSNDVSEWLDINCLDEVQLGLLLQANIETNLNEDWELWLVDSAIEQIVYK